MRGPYPGAAAARQRSEAPDIPARLDGGREAGDKATGTAGARVRVEIPHASPARVRTRVHVRVEMSYQYAGRRGRVQARVRVEITVSKKGPCAKLGYLQHGNQHSVRLG